jgi:hypothetical protein
MIKTISIQMAVFAILCFPICYKPIAAQAMTGEEFVKMFGVVDRYLQDIQKTFPSEPTPQAIAQPTPDIPQLNEEEVAPQ